MLIFRYIAKDLLISTFAVSGVLLILVASGRFVKYLARAAAGEMDAGVLLAIIGYRLPGFLELILPLAFFLGILLSYGRLYVQSEMTVMRACGMSVRRLVVYTMIPAVFVASIVAWLSLDVSPSGMQKAEALLLAQKERGELDGLIAGHFHPLQGGRGVTYTEEVTKQKEMRDVFLAENNPDAVEGKQLVLVVAPTGHVRVSPDPKEANFLVLEDGYRIEGVPGNADYQITRFEEYGQRLSKPEESRSRDKVDTLATGALMSSTLPSHVATLHWRLSVPVLVLVVALLAIPLSKTDPRQGRFAKTLPAVVLYMVYLVSLSGARGLVEDGNTAALVLMWGIHILFLGIAVLLFNWSVVGALFTRLSGAARKPAGIRS